MTCDRGCKKTRIGWSIRRKGPVVHSETCKLKSIVINKYSRMLAAFHQKHVGEGRDAWLKPLRKEE